MTLLAPVSWGELVDKITILEIKAARIADPAKLANVRNELQALTQVRDAKGSAPASLVAELRRVNEQLWDIEDQIRECEERGDFGQRFVELARSVYKTNDRRAALKRQVNDAMGSDLVEEKSYRCS